MIKTEEFKTNRLGIYCSNNINSDIFPIIRASLKSIKKASEGKADVLTCMWNHEPENPFPEFIAWTRSSSHLNQLLQIMQLLYNAKKIGVYEYISFLDHDLLYPEGYFDFPEFEEGCMMINTNYIGMNKEGFQPLIQRDDPVHQITVRIQDAIKHCELILPNALVTNSGNIEPTILKRVYWTCPNPPVHFNHGRNFTSHFNTYGKTEIFKQHPYWGDHDKYRDLFPN